MEYGVSDRSEPTEQDPTKTEQIAAGIGRWRDDHTRAVADPEVNDILLKALAAARVPWPASIAHKVAVYLDGAGYTIVTKPPVSPVGATKQGEQP
jgi:hypothetical protein